MLPVKNEKCEICKNFHEFEFPEHLLSEIKEHNVIVFAGSGVSTEKQRLLPETLFENIAYKLGHENCDKPFPELMEEFCAKPNGRIELLEIIRHRFNNIKSFPELYRNATSFHREVSTIPQIQTFVTTNWDTFFEDETGSIPFVTSEDVAFWNTHGRKVLKIHGSINNLGSIVVTKKDYDDCFNNLKSGVIGSILKLILATNTVLFIGYSMSDFDFNELYSFINNELNKYKRQAYIVTLDNNSIGRFSEMGLIPIHTDATYFIEVLKCKLIESDHMLSGLHLYAGELLHHSILYAHEKLHKNCDYQKHPSIVYAGAYQDGMIHAIERSLEMKKTGYYNNRINLINIIDHYHQLKKEYIKAKNYYDAAYVYGYMIIIMFYLFLHEEDRQEIPPLYFIYGAKKQPEKYEDFVKLINKSEKLHKSSFALAKHIVKTKFGDGENKGIDLHHPAFL